MRRIALLEVLLATVAVVVIVIVIAVLARYADGPIGPFAGGPLRGDVWRGAEPEWALVADVDTIEVQVNPRRPRSVHTGVIAHDGKLYVPTTLERFTRWHRHVLEDPRVILRIDGRLYRRCATRVRNRPLLKTLIRSGRLKYGFPFHTRSTAKYTWYWRMDPPDACFPREET